MQNLPDLHLDPVRGTHHYKKNDILMMDTDVYKEWVYNPKTVKADEVRMYENYYTNYLLTRCPLWVPYLFWPPLIYFLLTEFPFHWGIFLVGILGWFPLEYFLHKNLYHLEPKTKKRQKFHLMLHGVHHLAPGDLHHIVSPPHEILIQGIVVWGLLKILHVPFPETLVAALFIQYMRYDTFHYVAHGISYDQLAKLGFVGKYFEKCKRQHVRHHFVDPTREFAISFVYNEKL